MSIETDIAAAIAGPPDLVREKLNSRVSVHGEFRQTAAVARALMSEIGPMDFADSALMHALDMICVKLARIASGDPLHADHWLYIAGYAMLAHDHLTAAEPGQTDRRSD